jgi:hypothetical protein
LTVQALCLERGTVGEDEQHALAGDQLDDAGFLGQAAMQAGAVGQQRRQAMGGGGDPGLGRAGLDEAAQPGQQLRQIGPPDRQRPQRIGQIPRHLLPQAGG